MPIPWHRKWALINKGWVDPVTYREKWTLRDLMEAMTALAAIEDAEVNQMRAHRASKPS